MHCPNCATKISGDQKFCRSCGLKLERVYQLLSEELSSAELHTENKIRRFEHWRNVAGLWTSVTFVMVLLGVLIREIIVNLGTGSSDLYPAIIGLVLFLGLVVALSFTAYAAYLRQKQTQRKLQQTESVNTAAQTMKLAPDADHLAMPSVTEGTTKILETHSTEGGDYGAEPHLTAGVRSRDGKHAQDA